MWRVDDRILGRGYLAALLYGLLPTIWVGFASLKPVAEVARSRGRFLPVSALVTGPDEPPAALEAER